MVLLVESSLAANETVARRLDALCDSATPTNPLYARYFNAMQFIYPGNTGEGTCLPIHKTCGWPKEPSKNLPLFVLSVGLEGAGHHLWTEILEQPVFDCVWTNARHYFRDIADGVPRATAAQLKSGFQEQLQLRRQSGKPPCKSIYDSEDSFPTGAIRANGRIFMRPDIINLQQLDGVMFNIKYLIIVRNTTVSVEFTSKYTFVSTATVTAQMDVQCRIPRSRRYGETSSVPWTQSCARWSTR
jgi:hypothetical protein